MILVWAGSVINSMQPLLFGQALVGEYSSNLKPATLFNVPWVLVPSLMALQTLRRLSPNPRGRAHSQTKPFLILLHCGFILVHCVRMIGGFGTQMAAMRHHLALEPVVASGAAYIKIQVAQSFFWLIPYHVYQVLRLCERTPPDDRNTGIGWLVVGAGLQQSMMLSWVGCLEYPSLTLAQNGCCPDGFVSAQLLFCMGLVMAVGCQTSCWRCGVCW
eukprot:TRINITY_DN2298_c0_g1_i1.p1 TRINITY_DN2298_c0_g1~~TRINITY_DN2298_c0_g1_i1.p1  ORF type:complete len:216 (-),score=32.14 TRINITY_DN2298_c0_g1_i1:180-827(-)